MVGDRYGKRPLLPGRRPFAVGSAIGYRTWWDHQLGYGARDCQQCQAKDNCNHYDMFHGISPLFEFGPRGPVALAALLDNGATPSCPAKAAIFVVKGLTVFTGNRDYSL